MLSETRLTDSEDLHAQLSMVQTLLTRQQVLEELVQNDTPKPYFQELQNLLASMHSADIAFILEALPLQERLLVWDLVKSERDGEILLEVSDAVRDTLIDSMAQNELVAATQNLDADEIADLAPALPDGVIDDVYNRLPANERERLRSAMSYPEDTVGSLMDFDYLTVREDVTLGVVLRYLRFCRHLPEHSNALFVVDRALHLKGVLSLERLLLHSPHALVSDVMEKNCIFLSPNDDTTEASETFQRYDLLCVPVVDSESKLLGRLTVNAVMDFIKDEADDVQLAQAGLKEGEDIFAPVWDSLKNRWHWLAINLVTALIATRVIGAFEDVIAHLVALAALMPIVAGIGGNSGNQTITMIVRAIAMGQVLPDSLWRLLKKELMVALLNGIIWGSMMGLVAYWLYENWPLSFVLIAAMILNLLLAALAGVGIPLLRQRFGADPALGSSVLITALTDSGGFFIFLGLASLFL